MKMRRKKRGSSFPDNRNPFFMAVRTAFARAFFAAFPKSEPPGPPRGPVAFIRWDGKYGDWVVSAFMFGAVRESFVKRVVAICSPGQEALYRRTPGVDDIVVCRRKNVADVIRTGWALRRMKCDMVVELTDRARWSDLLVMALSGARMRLKGTGPKIGSFTRTLDLPVAAHMVERNAAFLECIGARRDDWRFDWRLPESADAKARSAWGDRPGPRVLLNPFAAGAGRNLPADWVEAFCRALPAGEPMNLVMPCPPGAATDTSDTTLDRSVITVAPVETIEETAALVRLADLVITPDTSIVHVACFFERPLIALYPEEEPAFARWYPRSDVATVVRPLPEETMEAPPSLRRIDPERIAKLALERLARAAAPRVLQEVDSGI